MKGRKDKDGIHEAWLTKRFDRTDNPTQSQSVPLLNSIWTLNGVGYSVAYSHLPRQQYWY